MATKEQFAAYYKVQMEGRYNMLDRRAIELTGLSREVYFDIITHYDEYRKKYMGGR